jgi:hypothetical protein
MARSRRRRLTAIAQETAAAATSVSPAGGEPWSAVIAGAPIAKAIANVVAMRPATIESWAQR